MNDTLDIRIDQRLDSYRSYFDHSWARRVANAAEGSQLEGPVFALCVNWKATANACALPWLLAQSVPAALRGHSPEYEPYGRKALKALRERVDTDLGDSLSHMTRKKFKDWIRVIEERVRQELDRAEPAVTAEMTWRECVDAAHAGNPEFSMSIWGLQRTAYIAIFFAYEEFLRACTGLAKKNPDYRVVGFRKFATDVKTCFGADVASQCLDDERVDIARLVRNALAHNGGGITDELRKKPLELRVVDDIIQIMAPDTRELFDLLKVKVDFLVEKALTLPALQ